MRKEKKNLVNHNEVEKFFFSWKFYTASSGSIGQTRNQQLKKFVVRSQSLIAQQKDEPN